MGDWSLLGDLVKTAREQSTLLGHIWLVILLLFRVLVLATVGNDVFQDEQEKFVCNTLQPGCNQVCYDQAFPVSHYRFWLFHALMLSVPTLVLALVSMHQAGKENGQVRDKETGQEKDDEEEELKSGEKSKQSPKARRRRHPSPWYLLGVLLRLLIELGLPGGQLLLQGFRVAPHFLCTFPPCPHTVDCYVSRPTEKTVFLIFYFTIGLLSALFSAVELLYLLWKVDQNDEKRGSCLESLLHPDEPRTQHRNSQGKRCSGRSKVSSAALDQTRKSALWLGRGRPTLSLTTTGPPEAEARSGFLKTRRTPPAQKIRSGHAPGLHRTREGTACCDLGVRGGCQGA